MSKSGIEKFAAGVAVGAVAGILLAPKSGKETREDLKNAFNDLLEKAKNIKAEDVKAAIEKKVAEIKEGLADLDKEKVLEIAKEKAAALKEKCNDLVAYAKEKGTPVVEKAAAEVREKAIQVTKEVLKKLENKETK
jgi:gas vesicle protein